MKLVVGLGNIGSEYDNTRHNIGFRVVDKICDDHLGSFSNFENIASVAKIYSGDAKIPILLVKPKTYMNNSGLAVARLINYYKIKIQDIIVIVDDSNLDLGNIRFRNKGSAGGHNGLKSIIEHLGITDFARLRIGVGIYKGSNLSKFVLSNFPKKDEPTISDSITDASDAISLWIQKDAGEVMQKFNRKN